MRIVLDTNVVASALLWGGTPERLIDAAGEGTLELLTSSALLAELAGILERAKFAQKLKAKNLSAAEALVRYRELADTVEATPIEERRGFAIPTTQRYSPARSPRARQKFVLQPSARCSRASIPKPELPGYLG